ncbi:alpha/beta fold hydrolase [Asticcacaulis sp. BYS171W]|uniref:Alpha/beta fold hydrolase n=1 Tax=Asticcacaulis aquaticus TaxID=2984212 RepID=A0ABT5HTK1_9CAUL|nr:alpha/beta fold hydrolase [Asticcacaulis aquaticus]MDC7683401.1 alpha/beta fold hydrolase [Asticcacaulis aquaticus]
MSRIAALSSTAPLMAIPESRPPEGGVGEWFRGAGGLRLRLGFWQPKGTPRGTVFVSPGRSEPIEKYYEVVSDLLARRFCVVVHDWRGQGLSARLLPDRLKGHARSTEEFLDDYQRLLDGFEERAPKPWIMMGHSMGAALNLSTLIKGEERFGAAIFINPMLRIKTGKHSLWSVTFQTDWKVRHGQGTDYVPELFDDPFEHTFEDDALCHDEHRYNIWREQLFACPHLAIGTPTWGWLNFAFRIGETLLKDKGKLIKKVRTPVSIVCSGDDTLMMKQPSKMFAKKLPKGRYVEIPGADHEVLMELDEYRRQFWAEFDEMAEATLPAPVTFASPPVSAAPVQVVEAAPVPVAAEVFDSHVPEAVPAAGTAVEPPEDNLSVAPPVEAEADEPAVEMPKPALFVAYELSDVPAYAPPLEPAEEIEVVDWEEAVSAEKVEPEKPAKPDGQQSA